MVTHTKKSTLHFDPRYPHGELPKVTREKLLSIANKKTKSAEDVTVLRSEEARAARKIGHFKAQPKKNTMLLVQYEAREASASKTATIAGFAIDHLAQTGARKIEQASDHGAKGAEHRRSLGNDNRKAVLEAARGILEKWTGTRRPSGRKLAKMVANKTGMAFDTVKGHIQNLRKSKILD